MDVSNLIQKMHIDGFDLHVENENIRVNSRYPLTDDQRQYLKQHKTEILRYLVHLESANLSNYTLWFYQIDNQDGYTRMGLMTADRQQAQKQLEARYNKPITSLQRRQ